MSTGSNIRLAVIATSLAGAMTLGGYLLGSQLIAGGGTVNAAPAPQPQALPVTVVEVKTEARRLWSAYTGRLSAIDSVELRPQVSGTIAEVRFEDGQMVTKGDVLLVIDPRPFAAAVTEAKAELSAAFHTLDLAKKQRDRAEKLVTKGHIARSTLDERVNDHTVSLSRVESAKAKLEQAEIDLDHAYVKAPISGQVSRAEITEGNLVEAGPNAPVLTSIVATEGIYADFEIDERSYLRYMRAVAKTGRQISALPVELTIDAGELRRYQGRIHSFDNQVDPATGTIRARAIFANEDGSLLPGLFAELRLGGPEVAEVVLMASSAIGTDQDRKFVYVVDEANRVVYREVTLGASIDGARVITDGLEAGEWVVVGGLMKVRPGMQVAPRRLDGEMPAAKPRDRDSIALVMPQ